MTMEERLGASLPTERLRTFDKFDIL
jgi:hypothetical protein